MTSHTLPEIVERVRLWCVERRVTPSDNRTGLAVTVRNARYYQSLGLLDGPRPGTRRGYHERHVLQLKAIRALQARGAGLDQVRALIRGLNDRDLAALVGAQLGTKPPPLGKSPGRPRGSPAPAWQLHPLGEHILLLTDRPVRLDHDVAEQVLRLLDLAEAIPKPDAVRERSGRKRSATPKPPAAPVPVPIPAPVPVMGEPAPRSAEVEFRTEFD